jgi:hypothetical protein
MGDGVRVWRCGSAVALTAECDLVAVLLDEHRALQSQTEPLQARGCDARTVVALVMELCWYGRTLQRHLDPVVRRYVPDGQARADRCLGAYVEVERMVAELRSHRLGEAHAVPLLERLICRLRDYLTDQERELLPRVRRHVPAEVLRQRGVLAIRGGRGPDPAGGSEQALAHADRHWLPQCIHAVIHRLWSESAAEYTVRKPSGV